MRFLLFFMRFHPLNKEREKIKERGCWARSPPENPYPSTYLPTPLSAIYFFSGYNVCKLHHKESQRMGETGPSISPAPTP